MCVSSSRLQNGHVQALAERARPVVGTPRTDEVTALGPSWSLWADRARTTVVGTAEEDPVGALAATAEAHFAEPSATRISRGCS